MNQRVAKVAAGLLATSSISIASCSGDDLHDPAERASSFVKAYFSQDCDVLKTLSRDAEDGYLPLSETDATLAEDGACRFMNDAREVDVREVEVEDPESDSTVALVRYEVKGAQKLVQLKISRTNSPDWQVWSVVDPAVNPNEDADGDGGIDDNSFAFG